MHDIEKSPNCLENEVVAVEHILMSFKKIFVSKINQQFKCDAKPTQMGGFDFSFSKKNREFETNDFLNETQKVDTKKVKIIASKKAP